MTVLHSQLAALALSTLALVGCGGDGPSSPALTPPPSAAPLAPGEAAPRPTAAEDPDAVAEVDKATLPSKGINGVVSGSDEQPIGGVMVTIVGDLERTTTTGKEGAYEFLNLPQGDLLLRFTKTDFIDQYVALHVWTDPQPTIDAELYRASTEAAEFAEAHGTPWDASKGVVFVDFESRADAKKVLYGGGATLGAKGAVAKVTSPDGTLVAGTVVPDKAMETSVEYIGVPAGDWALTITPPEGQDCYAPARVKVVAGAYSTAFVSCEAKTR